LHVLRQALKVPFVVAAEYRDIWHFWQQPLHLALVVEHALHVVKVVEGGNVCNDRYAILAGLSCLPADLLDIVFKVLACAKELPERLPLKIVYDHNS